MSKIVETINYEEFRIVSEFEQENIAREVDEWITKKLIDGNRVCFGFQAFFCDGSNWLKIGQPVFSNTLKHSKGPTSNDLKIDQMSVTESSASGGARIFMFVEKVTKGKFLSSLRIYNSHESFCASRYQSKVF